MPAAHEAAHAVQAGFVVPAEAKKPLLQAHALLPKTAFASVHEQAEKGGTEVVEPGHAEQELRPAAAAKVPAAQAVHACALPAAGEPLPMAKLAAEALPAAQGPPHALAA